MLETIVAIVFLAILIKSVADEHNKSVSQTKVDFLKDLFFDK